MLGFQVGLGVLFAVIVLAVFCVNKWQMYRLRSQLRADKAHQEPASAPVTVEEEAYHVDIDPEYDKMIDIASKDRSSLSFASEEDLSSKRGLESLNEQLDDMVWLSFSSPFTPEEVLILCTHLHNRSPFARVLVWDSIAQVWVSAQNNTMPVYKICCAVQLVSAEGMIEQSVLEGIRRLCRNIATEYRGEIVEQSLESVMHRAFLLDQFVSEMDIEIRLSVLAEHHFFPGTKLRSLAEAFGCRLNDEGFFQRMSLDTTHALFMMKSVDSKPFQLDVMRMHSYQGVSLLMDFPCTQDPMEAFSQMLSFARRLSMSLCAVIVDDHGDILKEAGFESIRKSLMQLTKRMHQYQVPPGSPLSFRIFRATQHSIHSS